MKIDQLQYFVEAAKHEHIGKAAKAVAISPSAISHSISLLEEELGRELFTKQGKRIVLTSHGKLLMEKAEGILRSLERVREEMQSETVELQGHYRLAASHVLCAEILAPGWCRLQRVNPNISAELFTLRSSQVVTGVATGEFDLGVCFSPHDHPELDKRTLHTGQLLVVLAPGHPLWDKPANLRLAKLSEYPCVLPKAFQGIDVCVRHPVFEKFQIRVSATSLFDSYDVAAAIVARGEAWSFFPDVLLKGQAGRIKAIRPPAGWEAPYSVSAVWSRNRVLTNAMKQLLGVLEVDLCEESIAGHA